MKRKLFTVIGASILILPRIAPAQNTVIDGSGDDHCTQLNQIVINQVANGQTKKAEAALSKALASSSNRCASAISRPVISNQGL